MKGKTEKFKVQDTQVGTTPKQNLSTTGEEQEQEQEHTYTMTICTKTT